MSDEINVEGKRFILSKIAAERSGYTQDYIGQLARNGGIEAKQVDGLWYVNLDSIFAHKNNAEKYTPVPPKRNFVAEGVGSIILFDGNEYISSKRAADITGYTQDYVAQLARASKIPSRQVGKRWYVSKKKLVAHREHNDALLAAVQAESVGISRNSNINQSEISKDGERYAHMFSYTNESDKDLVPNVPEKSYVDNSSHKKYKELSDNSPEIVEEHHIPIHIQSMPRASAQENGEYAHNIYHSGNDDMGMQKQLPSRTILPMLAGAVLTTVLILAVGFGLFLPGEQKFTRNSLDEGVNAEQVAASIFGRSGDIVDRIDFFVINFVSDTRTYVR